MSNFVDYSCGLMKSSKGLRTQALLVAEEDVKQTLQRAALLHACSFLEAHLNYMADHFQDSPMFTLHERGLLLEKEVVFEKGKYVLSTKLKISRVQDKIDLLLAKCANDPEAAKDGWYAALMQALNMRNSLVHPKEARTLVDSDVKSALAAVLMAADTLYNAVFKKRLPYAKKGIEGGLEFGPAN